VPYIVFPRLGGGVRVARSLTDLPPSEAAKSIVPQGRPFLIVADDDLPADRTYREAWDADFSQPDGHGEGVDDGI